jgi:tetratricopeptide (TPR) repeat protein
MPRKKSTHVDDPAEVGRRLKEARERAGLSQRQLAYEGCSPAYISRVEAGTRTPSLHVLAELAARLGVSDSWLATGKENRVGTFLRDAEIALRLDDMDEARRLYSAALDEADDPADPVSRSGALEGLAAIALRSGNPRRAISLAEEALSVTDERPEERPSLAESLARAHADIGELAPAIAVLERCVERFANDPVQFVRFSVLLGAALTDNGDYGQAERVIGSAIARGREVADPYTRARLYWSESRLLQEQGRHEAAEGYARKTLETLRATEDEYAIAHVLQMLAHIQIDLGRPGEALELLREGRGKIETVGTPLELAQYRIEEARALAALGEHEEAAALAMELTQKLGDARGDAARAYLVLAQSHAALGHRERAAEVYELAIELLEGHRTSRHVVTAYKEFAALLKEQGESERALELLERALGVQERVGRRLS